MPPLHIFTMAEDMQMREKPAARTARNQRRRRQRRRKRILRIILCLAVLAGVILLGCFTVSRMKEKREIQKQNDLKDLFENGASSESSAFGIPFFSAAYAEELPKVVDKAISDRFVELRKINADVIGWLEVGDNISTPIVYRDNEYYLDHDFYGEESASGTVFADVRNENWDTDPYVIFYGHNMKNDTMFGTLDGFQKLDYFIENTHVDFYSVYNNEVLELVPFAVVDASMEKEHSTYLRLRCFSSFRDPENLTEAQAFIDEVTSRSMYEIPGLEATTEDRIFALVTCSYELPDARFIVFCRQLREGETHEQLEQLIRLNAAVKEP